MIFRHIWQHFFFGALFCDACGEVLGAVALCECCHWGNILDLWRFFFSIYSCGVALIPKKISLNK